ncbi:hemin-degrading factor [Rhodalgimonas zhirmunskyi]|uniref:Hemin-degrading factor n=1 Tax=Rhodalgimonas zhirmunskyi TaxID=2964767 RepID=A0AAJ1UCG3_9RHOB|nr:ChuX/HutX family heme-like substrate-binding protein [Rhodoalgimonas zhirmunskyi]MDQ2093387.1 hemin-degrading factor [Rhodoalgimonas zhirmunskyi]
MTETSTVSKELSAAEIRAARADNPKMRDRDFADKMGISEAQLVAAYVGVKATRIAGDMDSIMPELEKLGEVMALTRNESCVIEKVGEYGNFTPGKHAGLVVNEEIDLRMFPSRWVHGFAIEEETEGGMRRTIQVFDAAGDAVHKVFLRDGSNAEAWPGVVAALKIEDQSDTLAVEPREPVEPAKGDPAKADTLRAEWDKLTDTHQFLMLTRKMKMNRLGAYRMAGAPYARRLHNETVEKLLHRAAERAVPIMVFVGNQGCIEIHTGPINKVAEMGPWINVLDPGFNLHLRRDHVAEVYAVTKSTKRGDAISIEAFDARGYLIAQFFGVLREEGAAEKWNALVAEFDTLEEAATA